MTETRELKRIQSAYFQKSLFFMYPLLSIPPKLNPVNSYLCWKKIKHTDCRLICLFEKTDESEMQQLEKQHLLANRYLQDVTLVKPGVIYVFDMSSMRNNWEVFLDGEYSYLSPYTKNAILKFYNYDLEKQTDAHCYLFPDQYYEQYAELLAVDKNLFYEDTELVRPPNLELETCRIK